MARIVLNQVTAIAVDKPDDLSFTKFTRRFSNTILDATDDQILEFAAAINLFYPGATVTATLAPTYQIQAD